MKYSQFERLVLSATAVLVLGTLAASIATGASGLAEIIGQLAVLAVMYAAVRWGRKAGGIAALLASVVYLGLQLPLLSEATSLKPAILVLTRLGGYCLIGIVGGEVFARMKYFMAAAGDSGMIDQWSGVYNQRYVVRALEQALARRSRYNEPFSLVLLELSVPAPNGQKGLRSIVRAAASFIRDDVRMVDDVSRLDDGRFLVLLPHTAGASAPIVADRLAEGARKALDLEADSLKTTCLGSDDDAETIDALLQELDPGRDQAESGA